MIILQLYNSFVHFCHGYKLSRETVLTTFDSFPFYRNGNAVLSLQLQEKEDIPLDLEYSEILLLHYSVFLFNVSDCFVFLSFRNEKRNGFVHVHLHTNIWPHICFPLQKKYKNAAKESFRHF
ncbi:hypothetical protein CEXT_351971 [Caerostris extrusa]|uniref:Uncharacterized protein n=1 Tax=Caerostris extrusa TaxID=172846 RepID=A0AAV4QJF6_CAEEX|nr:hypothetical protein CEXT_351971 [Caerostris extrusa]